MYAISMFDARHMFGKALVSAGIMLLLLGAFVGLPHFGMSTTMDEHGNMTMSDCSMPGMTTLCTMSPLEHLSSWQLAFASIVQEYSSTLLMMLLVVAVALSFSWVRQHYPPSSEVRISRYRLREEYFPPNQLQELFSDGILNPKPF